LAQIKGLFYKCAPDCEICGFSSSLGKDNIAFFIGAIRVIRGGLGIFHPRFQIVNNAISVKIAHKKNNNSLRIGHIGAIFRL